MYVAVKGGERAIDAAHRLLEEKRRGDPTISALSQAQVREQLGHAVSRVMAEGSCFDPDIAALALKQAQGDVIEAIFLVRAYRTTLPRFGYTLPLGTNRMRPERRVSGIFKDIPGGQLLGPTFDYTHRLLDFRLADEVDPDHRPPSLTPPEKRDEEEGHAEASANSPNGINAQELPQVLELLDQEGLIERSAEGEGAGEGEPVDLTRAPLDFPANRATRLQNLARGDEGFLLGLGYSTQRGLGGTHPFVGELKTGEIDIEIVPPELGFPVEIGSIEVTECQLTTQFEGGGARPPQFTRGYGLAFGRAERKTLAMALVDRALRAEELGERLTAPAQDQEFVLSHSDNIQATGFVEHLKLPHYVDFQSELDIVRSLRKAFELNASEASGHPEEGKADD